MAENGLVLAHVPVDERSKEIPALPKPLGVLDLEGANVTGDAMGYQVAIAEAVLAAGADYVITCKRNQSTLRDDVAAFFEHAGQVRGVGRATERPAGERADTPECAGACVGVVIKAPILTIPSCSPGSKANHFFLRRR